MDSLQPLLAFVETAKRGNFAAAARDLGCAASTLAKAVRRLEARLGVRLFHRTTRQVALTADGERLFARSQRVLAELDLLQHEASGTREEPSGTLRIDMPLVYGRSVILPLLAQLARRHPKLGIDGRFSDRYVDIVKEGIDVAIRAGELRDSSLVARRFASQVLILVAAPGYVREHGAPESVAALARHTGIVFRVPSSGRDRAWPLRTARRVESVLPPSRLRLDDGEAIAAAATMGLGIAQLPHYMVSDGIRRGTLVELLPWNRPPPMPLSAVIPSARLMPARVRALLDLLAASTAAFPAVPALPRAPARRGRRPARPARRAAAT